MLPQGGGYERVPFYLFIAAQLFYAFFHIPKISQKMLGKKEYTVSEIVKVLFTNENIVRN